MILRSRARTVSRCRQGHPSVALLQACSSHPSRSITMLQRALVLLCALSATGVLYMPAQSSLPLSLGTQPEREAGRASCDADSADESPPDPASVWRPKHGSTSRLGVVLGCVAVCCLVRAALPSTWQRPDKRRAAWGSRTCMLVHNCCLGCAIPYVASATSCTDQALELTFREAVWPLACPLREASGKLAV